MKTTYKMMTLALLIGLFMAVTAQAGQIVLIVNPASVLADVTAADISKLFRGKSTSVSSTKVVPVDQTVESAVRSNFSDRILGRSVKKMENYWKKQVFSGKGEPPATLSDDAAVIAHVASKPNAIGYISANSVTDKVKALKIDGTVKW